MTKPPLKRCPRCRGEKPAEDFHKNRRNPDGLAVYCRLCKQELDKARCQDPKSRFKRNLANRLWRQANLERHRENSRRATKAYRERHRETILVKTRERMRRQKHGLIKILAATPLPRHLPLEVFKYRMAKTHVPPLG